MQIELANICKTFGSQRVLYEVNARFRPGIITGIIGGNGQGKTSIFNIMSGYVKPDAGCVKIDGEEVTRRRPYLIARLGVGRLFQELRLFSNLTVTQNVITAMPRQNGENPLIGIAYPRKIRDQNRYFAQEASSLLQSVGLAKHENKYPTMLSYGESKLLALAVLLARQPKALLLDEPLAGLSAGNIEIMIETILRLRSENKTILVIEHDYSLISAFADSIIIIKDGVLRDYAP